MSAGRKVARFTRAWIETHQVHRPRRVVASPASRGRGLKLQSDACRVQNRFVARFTRAWIETLLRRFPERFSAVARFTRAWIETETGLYCLHMEGVARFTRAWIETAQRPPVAAEIAGRPLHAGVD